MSFLYHEVACPGRALGPYPELLKIPYKYFIINNLVVDDRHFPRHTAKGWLKTTLLT
jgi:hypothetical protein